MSDAGRPAHPRLPGRLLAPGAALADADQSWPVESSSRPYADGFLAVRVDDLAVAAGERPMRRTVVEHLGAVGVVALDEDGRVLLLEQYRHPVGRRLVEIPAGLLDVEGEDAQAAAARELGEETDVVAGRWQRLLSLYSSPGFTSERWTVFLAQDLEPQPAADRLARVHEEADMTAVWVPLAEAVAAAMDGRIEDGMAVAGILAAATAIGARDSLE